tara:strand:+ start:298 stop:2298 length:2001 start_codon:yes stop_codon:yes gene_type:complete
MRNQEKKFAEAKQLHNSGKIVEAQKLYLELIENNSSNYQLFFLIGTSYLQLENFEKAIAYLNNSIKINPKFPYSYNSKGIVFSENKEFEEAITNYNEAIFLKPDLFEAHLNKAISLKNIQKYEESFKSFEKCIEIEPNNPKIYYNRGNLFSKTSKFKEAKSEFDKAIKLKENYAEAYEGRADVLQELAKIQQDEYNFILSINNYEKAYRLNPNLNYVYGKLVHSKMLINDWEGLDESLLKIKNDIDENKKTIIPFPLLSLVDDPIIHKKNSKLFAYKRNSFLSIQKNKIEKKIDEKIKIGYFSADLNAHPVSTLISKMLSIHDKNKFKVYCYAFGFEKKDELHNWIEQEVDAYRDIRELTDRDVAKLAREDGIDIAIDLQGFTSKHRIGIFERRPAPIQINFLGYPGTMGLDYYDYIVADKNLIPESSREFYTEKPIYMPNNYQVQNDDTKVAIIGPNKKELGLPENKFIFCAINNTYKISPAVFDVWMRILQRVENSVLWLLDNSENSKNNLRKEAEIRNIDNNRLIFTKRTSYEKYLAAMKHADLYLDTFIYNAGATASNALWVGVPVLTMAGESYSARMASSLLLSLGVPELITNTKENYEKLAIELSTNAEKLKTVKKKIMDNRSEKPLFNTKMYTRHFEKGLEKVLENYIEGNEPKNIFIN